MKISLEERKNIKTVEISGSKMAKTPCDSFVSRKKNTPQLTGSTIKSDGYGYASITGELSYTLMFHSRCADPIQWEVSRNLEASSSQPNGLSTASEVDLIAEDFDFYYVEDNMIDVQQAVIDAILTSLPSQLVKKSEGHEHQTCGKDISTEEVYRSKRRRMKVPSITQKPQPAKFFLVLKGF